MNKTAMAASLMAILIMTPGIVSAAGETSSGTVTVSATVDPTISMTFVSDGSGVSLTGSGSAAATLPFGNINKYGTAPASTITRTLTGNTSWAVATPFKVLVEKANSSSANYLLSAQLDALGVYTWQIGGTTLNDTGTPAQIQATGTYGTATSYTLKLTIPDTSTTTAISNVISFVATSN